MITRGKYMTKGGFIAIVIKLKPFNHQWRWVGALICPETKALLLSEWDMEGHSPIFPDYSLQTKIETEKQK